MAITDIELQMDAEFMLAMSIIVVSPKMNECSLQDGKSLIQLSLGLESLCFLPTKYPSSLSTWLDLESPRRYTTECYFSGCVPTRWAKGRWLTSNRGGSTLRTSNPNWMQREKEVLTEQHHPPLFFLAADTIQPASSCSLCRIFTTKIDCILRSQPFVTDIGKVTNTLNLLLIVSKQCIDGSISSSLKELPPQERVGCHLSPSTFAPPEFLKGFRKVEVPLYIWER